MTQFRHFSTRRDPESAVVAQLLLAGCLWRSVDIRDLVAVGVGGPADHVVIRCWRPGSGISERRRAG